MKDMTEDSYPHSPDDVIATLAHIYREQSDEAMSSLLEAAEATIDFEGYDNWNWDQCYYSLQLKVPLNQFAQIEPRIESLERALRDKIGIVFKGTDPHFLTSVVITPLIKRTGGTRQNTGALDAIERIWGIGGFRLFLSHVSQHKERMAELKNTLAKYGVSAFVAHADIQPTQIWQSEIETALNTMHGMAAILTPEFKDSEWTDQEVGYALGRDIKIIPVKAGQLPYGLLARQQALAGDLDNVPSIAKGIVAILVKAPITQPTMRDALVEALVCSSCWADTKLVVAQLETIGTITSENADRIRVALKENPQVSQAYGVPRALETLLEPYEEKSTVAQDDELPF